MNSGRNSSGIVGRKTFPELYLRRSFRSDLEGGISLLTRAITFALALCLTAVLLGPLRAQQKPSAPSTPAAAAPSAILNTYCVTCHNDQAKTGGLSLEKADLSRVAGNAETWEKVIRKLRVGMMPPPGMPRPDKPCAGRLCVVF
jgi:mono/diheme cytochrome c family protein